jgi:hypothetical protein
VLLAVNPGLLTPTPQRILNALASQIVLGTTEEEKPQPGHALTTERVFDILMDTPPVTVVRSGCRSKTATKN